MFKDKMKNHVGLDSTKEPLFTDYIKSMCHLNSNAIGSIYVTFYPPWFCCQKYYSCL